MLRFSALATTMLALPLVTFAQFSGGDNSLNDFFSDISGFINDTLIPLVFAVALLIFIYGMFKYFILGGAEEDERKKGTQLMLYAIVGFVLMVSIFGIVNLIANGLGFSKDQEIGTIPNVPVKND